MLPAIQAIRWEDVFVAVLPVAVMFVLWGLTRKGWWSLAVRVMTGFGGAICVVTGCAFLIDYDWTNTTAGAVFVVGGLALLTASGLPVWERRKSRNTPPNIEPTDPSNSWNIGPCERQ